MGFVSFIGRVLFSAIFILAAWQKIQDFGVDGGGALKSMEPKIELFRQHVQETLHFSLPVVEMKYLLMAAIGLEGLGGLLFTFGSSLGAYLLLIFLAAVTPIMHDFYNFDLTNPEYLFQFSQFLKNLSLFGALLFFLGMKNSSYRQIRKKPPVKTKAQ
ncbi:unnamed protein product [Sphagnum troendelagicum]|uniref:DoxX family protein n=1 Tax=Sphagnum troendelagicum TaxID=128251 RepID=A0ABP0UD93_9BRYO